MSLSPQATAPDDWGPRSRELGRLLSQSALGDRSAFKRLYELSSGHLYGDPAYPA